MNYSRNHSFSKNMMLIILAFIILVAFMPSMAFAENSVSGTMSSSQFLAAKDENNTITLEGDVTLSDNLVISDGSTLIINLNGNTLSAKDTVIKITHGNVELTGQGEVKENKPFYAPVLLKGSANPDDANYSEVTVGKDVTLTGWSGLFIDRITSNGANVGYGIVANVYGTLNSVKDTSGAGGHALYVNGTLVATEGNIPKITLDGARLNTVAGNGIYLAGFADTRIINSTITSNAVGNTGIEIRAGKLYIENSIVAGGTGEFTVQPNGNGSTTSNVALAVVQHTTKLPLEITVANGTFTGGAALFEENAQKNDAAAIDKIKVDVQDGDFEGIVYSQNKEKFISGGSFNDVLEPTYISSSVDAKAKVTSKDGKEKYIYGENSLNRTIANLRVDDSIEFEQVPADKEYVIPEGVKVTNSTGSDMTINNVTVADGVTAVVKEPEPTDPSEPVNPENPQDKPSTEKPTTGNQEQTTGDKADADQESNSPKTGDDTMLLRYVIMMLAALGIGGTLVVNRKKN